MNRTDYLTLAPDAPVGVRIWYMREKLGMTQRELAKAIYGSQASVMKWELGQFVPCYQSASQLARVFGVTTDWLMAREEKQHE